MNKIKEELRQKLSDEKTQLDVDNVYSVVKKSVLSFNLFYRKYYSTKQLDGWDLGDNIWRDYETDAEYTTEELFKIWENEK